MLSPEGEVKPDDEAIYRSVASRLYYAAYHKALNFADLHSLRVVGDAKGTHDQLYKRLHGRNSMLARKLRSMKDIRCDADYVIDVGFEKSKVVEQEKRLQDFEDMLARS